MPFFAMLWLSAEAAGAAHGGAHTAPPLIDFDGTVLLQFVLFMVALFILSKSVFTPFLAVQEEREDRIDGERQRAAELEEQLRSQSASLDAKLRSARKQGLDERASIRQEAQAFERETLERAQAEATSLMEHNRQVSQKASAEASAKLRAETANLAHAMVSRLLGRDGGPGGLGGIGPGKPREVA